MQARMSLSLLCALSLGSSVSGVARRTCVVNSASPCSTVSGVGPLVLGDDHDRRGADSDARVLVGRRLHPAGAHQPHVHAIRHPVGGQRVVDRAGQLVAADAEVDHQRGRALPEPVEVLLEERRVAVVHPQPLPDAVAEHEAGVEDRHRGLGARLQLAVDPDEDLVVARVVSMVMSATRHTRDISEESPKVMGAGERSDPVFAGEPARPAIGLRAVGDCAERVQRATAPASASERRHGLGVEARGGIRQTAHP